MLLGTLPLPNWVPAGFPAKLRNCPYPTQDFKKQRGWWALQSDPKPLTGTLWLMLVLLPNV